MKLWLLTVIAENQSPFDEYDLIYGFVIRAPDAREARTLAAAAARNSTDESASAWIDANLTKCEELRADGPEAIILRDRCSG